MDVEKMKALASVDKDGKVWHETGEGLIRCHANGAGYEWRLQLKAYDPRGGRKINEATAATILARC